MSAPSIEQSLATWWARLHYALAYRRTGRHPADFIQKVYPVDQCWREIWWRVDRLAERRR